MSGGRRRGAGRDARLRKLIQHASDFIGVIDREYRLTFASPSLERIVGYTEAELLGRSILEIIHPDDRDAAVARVEALFRSAGATSGPNLVRIRRRDGGWVWMENLSSNLFDDPDVLGMALIGRDVTERIRTAHELAERARREQTIARAARRLLEASYDEAMRDVAAWVGEVMSLDTLRIFELGELGDTLVAAHEWRAPGIAPNAARLAPVPLGTGEPIHASEWTEAERREWRVDDVDAWPPGRIPARDRLQEGDLKAAIGVAANHSGGVIVALVGGMCRAARAWCDDDAQMLSIAGELIAIGEMRRRAEASLAEAKAAAEAANRSKSTFLAHMSHELRTPLNGVIGMVDLLARTPLTERQHRYVDAARSSADLLLSVVNDVLDFSKIEANKLELDHAPFHLASAIEDTVASLAPAAEQKGLDLACRLAPALSTAVLGDAMRLRQIVVNLVGNAVKFTERGEVVVTGALLDIDPPRVAVRIEIRDTGIGLSREQSLRLFAPFSQPDASIARRFGGTGLGLAICRMLVERMGGEIGVVSEVGRGSTFHFTARFDRADALAPASPGRAPSRPRAREGLQSRAPSFADAERPGPEPRHVLVAEDGEVNAEVVGGVLASAGHTYDCVSSGRAALDALVSRSYDLALMDCLLPDISGLDVTRAVRRIEAEGRLPGRGEEPLPIFALTADVTIENQRACAEVGMTGFLSKPVDAERLLVVVAQQPRPAMSADGASPIADIQASLGRLQGNRALFARIAADFVGGIEARTQKLRAAVVARDPPAVAFECHRLGSQVATFDAGRAGSVVRAVRAAAGAGDWALAERWLAELEHELSLLGKVLTETVRSP